MGYRIVRVTEELFTHLLSDGATWPNKAGQRLKVTKGLPADARLFAAQVEMHCGANVAVLLYSSAEWADEGTTPPPEFRVEFSSESLPMRLCACCGGRGWTLSDSVGTPLATCGECKGSGWAADQTPSPPMQSQPVLDGIEENRRQAFENGVKLKPGVDYNLPPDDPDAPHIVTNG